MITPLLSPVSEFPEDNDCVYDTQCYISNVYHSSRYKILIERRMEEGMEGVKGERKQRRKEGKRELRKKGDVGRDCFHF